MPPTLLTPSVDKPARVGSALIKIVTGPTTLSKPSLELLLPWPSILSTLPKFSPLVP